MKELIDQKHKELFSFQRGLRMYYKLRENHKVLDSDEYVFFENIIPKFEFEIEKRLNHLDWLKRIVKLN